jgi:hypothetical protein
VEKYPSEKRIDVAKPLGLPPSTLNMIIVKKNIREQADTCGTSAKERKTGKVSTYELENVLFAWYCQARASGILVDGSILREKSLKIAATMGIENFSALNSWISGFKQHHGLVCKKLAGESAAVDTNATDLWFERLPKLLEGYEARVIYNADETGLFFYCLPDGMLALKGETCHGGKSVKEQGMVLLCTNSDGSGKRVPIVIGKSAKPWCLKSVKQLPVTCYANSKAWMKSGIFSIIQPLDLGVIKCFKKVYRKQIVQRTVCLMDAGKWVQLKIDIWQAIHFIVSAWQQVIQSTV